jgi:hypothetical protein
MIKRGDKWSRLSYGEVTDINGDSIFLKNEYGLQWSISKAIFDKEFNLASPHESEEAVSRTRLTEIILDNTGVVMTVNFNKKVDEKAVKEILDNALRSGPSRAIETKALAKHILQGEERTIVGRHNHHIDEMGRLQFVDMELALDDSKEYDVRLRKVDPRTVNWVIVKNVKYKVK